MDNPYVPKLVGPIGSPFSKAINGDMSGYVHKSAFTAPVSGPSFKDVVFGQLNNVNKIAGAPDALMKEAMTTGRVDVHDVMLANAKAELAIQITTQVVTKAVQAYDRVLQIQI